MSDEKQYKKYNSQAKFSMWNVRVTKDAQIITDDFVKFTVVLTSRQESDVDAFIDVIPGKFDTELCKFLKKGDVVSFEGFPHTREYEGKRYLGVKQATMFLAPSLFGELKERGWTPGGKSVDPAPAQPKAKAKNVVSITDPDDDL